MRSVQNTVEPIEVPFQSVNHARKFRVKPRTEMFSDAVERSIETDGAEIVRQHGRLELHMSRVEANGREMMCAQGYVLLCL